MVPLSKILSPVILGDEISLRDATRDDAWQGPHVEGGRPFVRIVWVCWSLSIVSVMEECCWCFFHAHETCWIGICVDFLVFVDLDWSGQISIISKPELRGFWGSSLIKPPFRVTSADVVIICPDWCFACCLNSSGEKQYFTSHHASPSYQNNCPIQSGATVYKTVQQQRRNRFSPTFQTHIRWNSHGNIHGNPDYLLGLWRDPYNLYNGLSRSL